MLENIVEILEISQLNANKLTYNYTLFNVKEIVSEILDTYSSLITEKNINITLNSEDNIFINSDKYRVKQIVSNIVSNAIKYGNDEIVITLLNKENVIITIEDNGDGIKDKDAIWNLYSQGDSDLLERKSNGTGIGLYFTKLLCRDLNINYKVEDREIDSGSKFTLGFSNKTNKGNS